MYYEVSNKAATTRKRRRHVSVSGMLTILGVSRYHDADMLLG